MFAPLPPRPAQPGRGDLGAWQATAVRARSFALPRCARCGLSTTALPVRGLRWRLLRPAGRPVNLVKETHHALHL